MAHDEQPTVDNSTPCPPEIKLNPEDQLKVEAQNDHQVTPPTTPAVRRDFYQTESDVVVNILAKNVNKGNVSVVFTDTTMEIGAKLADGQDYRLHLNLFGPIKPSASSFQVTGSKIEIKMRKDSAGTWTALESENEEKRESRPSGPWISKIGKDWNKLEKEIEKEATEYDSEINPFSALYGCCDDDTKRAMMKSMEESGGTVLSMNWNEVGQKKVERYKSKDEEEDD